MGAAVCGSGGSSGQTACRRSRARTFSVRRRRALPGRTTTVLTFRCRTCDQEGELGLDWPDGWFWCDDQCRNEFAEVVEHLPKGGEPATRRRSKIEFVLQGY